MKKYLLSVAILMLSVCGGLFPQAMAVVVLEMSFEHLAGDADGLTADGQLCVDSSGNGYHGFYAGGSGAAVVPGAADAATALDTSDNNIFVILRDDRIYTGHGEPGIDDPVTTPTPYFTLQADQSYTFEAVLKWDPTSPDSRHGIFGQTGGNEFWLAENNGSLIWAAVSNGVNANNFGSACDISSLEADGQWHHLALVLDRTAGQIRVYADYHLIYTDMNPNIGLLGEMLSGTGDTRLGAYNTSSGTRFDGQMDHFVISNATLSEETFVLADYVTVNATATDPNPANHTAGVDPNTVLAWGTNPVGAFTYDVYFGTDPESLPLVSAQQSQKSYNPLGTADLEWNTQYYWKVVLHDDDQSNESLVWNFTTIQPVCSPPLPGDLSGDCVVDMTDLIILIEHWLDQP